VTLVEDDGVIEQFATHASDPALWRHRSAKGF
jgi:hypothetical protein